ncbi:MICAL-like protein 1 isoform X2 [Melanotaenia boesemani]|uniref:MICAL-like protein 1 isoform X2 n=1 Tax=Melanotaenia boesemani TaxID=1250792 RepID=UPI001C046B33|nr:MICAL-like protein 1 isoform X2 [Melanotaenia boesemani]
MASAKALQEWCRVTCANYPTVEIKNMSTSFRNGLAFCAIIHKHRPDLIDFSSLSKDNVYENNKLAFEVAETKLGIPTLLDVKDMVSSKVPDCLSVITYLSQYYYFFNKKSCGPSRSWSPHVAVLNNITKNNKTPDGQKPLKSSTDLKTNKEGNLANTKTQAVCNLCFKPVHLIQRHLVDGKVYHRSCFRCKLCDCTLLLGSYTQGRDSSSLICAYHVTNSKAACHDINQQIRSTDNRTKSEVQAEFFSLSGAAISSLPRYAQTTESQGRLVNKTQTEGSRKVGDREKVLVGLPHPPQPSVKQRTLTPAEKTRLAPSVVDSKVKLKTAKTSELSSSCAQGAERSVRPVPAPRRSLDASAVPVPAPRTKTFQTMSGSTAANKQTKSTPGSSHTTLTRTSPKVKTNHPWMTIVYPGPWTQLPPAAAPVPVPRSTSVSAVRVSSNRPKMPPPNPFEEEEVEDTQEEAAEPESANQSKPSGPAVHSENSGDTHAVVCSRDAKNPFESEQEALFREGGKDAAAAPVKDVSVVTSMAGTLDGLSRDSNRTKSSHVTAADLSSTSADCHILPRSLSVPAITSDHSQTNCEPVRLKDPSAASCQSKPACKENPFDQKPEMSKSQTFQNHSSSRGPAPGYGFPLIKRKVQTDLDVSSKDLQVQVRDLGRHLEALEQRGVELERNLRDCKKGKGEEQMLTEWISLIHERQILSCKDIELVYLTKQQKLEDRQADVEYELRCLLNKPGSEWRQEDRNQEQQLMDELVAIIEQRNQIVSSLDQDREREREEDVLWEGKMKNKDFQRDGNNELKKSKGKFKPSKVFKILNPKRENSKDSEKKS